MFFIPLKEKIYSTFLILLVLLIAIFLYLQHLNSLTIERKITSGEASAVIGAVSAGINVHARQSTQYIEGRLQEFLEQLVNTSTAASIALAGGNGEIFMSAGDHSLLQNGYEWTNVESEDSWSPISGHIRFYKLIEQIPELVGQGRNRRSREQWVDLPSGPFKVVVAIDASEFNSRTTIANQRFGVTLLSLAVITFLSALALRFRNRRRNLEEQLWKAKETTRQMKQLAQLGAGLAHETKNPLAIVRGLLQSLADSAQMGGENRDDVNMAIDEVDRTVGRINTFLQFARPLKPSMEKIAILPVLSEVTGLLRMEANHGVTIESNCCDPELFVRADKDMLRRVLFNLGLNALKATASGGKLSFQANKTGAEVELNITDTGKGIASEDLPHITEPYFTRSKNGSGLGLAIVQRIASSHGWQMKIISEQGSGTMVTLRNIELA
ncbi:ATP-binding protein [Chitinispirillales bacterium ANBcel5]|uniref:sensor histidine kinase n=1 Tax=Cellulosispirillum alkaliphilum TaxID=3039283 RepID=UPI002A53897C|nr:ATP-binding protein [Chitinispirillales bacterium ANBcel5]